jgi:thiol:disulfide interchange protein
MTKYMGMTKRNWLILSGIVIIILIIVIIYLVRKNKKNEGMKYMDKDSPKPSDRLQQHDPSSQQQSQKKDLVLFHGNWCGACQQFKPMWEQIKNAIQSDPQLSSKLNVLEVESADQATLQAHSITGLPTMKVCKNGLGDVANSVKFEGPRDPQAIIRFALDA